MMDITLNWPLDSMRQLSFATFLHRAVSNDDNNIAIGEINLILWEQLTLFSCKSVSVNLNQWLLVTWIKNFLTLTLQQLLNCFKKQPSLVFEEDLENIGMNQQDLPEIHFAAIPRIAP